ncbi:MAG: bifunctional ornithine acetyltransferase/N-acetylglutamate synthase, partial [Sedimenticolaceae bacterium]
MQARVPGVRLSTAAAGIRYKGRDDLLLIELAQGGTCAAVFTRNAFCAAPVTVAREHLAKGPVRYLLINAGNANAGTGSSGLRAARETCRLLAGMAGCALSQVLPFSTGVIGEDLPVDPSAQSVPG